MATSTSIAVRATHIAASNEVSAFWGSVRTPLLVGNCVIGCTALALAFFLNQFVWSVPGYDHYPYEGLPPIWWSIVASSVSVSYYACRLMALTTSCKQIVTGSWLAWPLATVFGLAGDVCMSMLSFSASMVVVLHPLYVPLLASFLPSKTHFLHSSLTP